MVDILRKLPVRELADFAAELLARGHTPGEVVDLVADLGDELVDWREVVKGPVGAVLEATDRAILRSFVRLVVATAHRQLGA